jgi:hypothetical protein
MDPDRDGQHRTRRRERDGVLARGDVLAARDDRHDACGARSSEDLVGLIETWISEVRVRVDVQES